MVAAAKHHAEQRDETERSTRLREFGKAIDEIRARVEADLGPKDAAYIRRLDTFSRVMERAGRLLIHFSLEPISFSAGVAALWIHKTVQATEVGHTVLHGTYDSIEGAEAYRSEDFDWDIPIDEESWRYGHNIRHHQYTNIAGKDPDIHFGFVRLTEQTPLRAVNRIQLPVAILAIAPSFDFVMNAHFTGLIDAYFGNGRPERFDFLSDRSWKSLLSAHKKALRKYVPYYFKNYVFYPALAGPFFPKVLLGNWLAEAGRNVYIAATIFCGHVGEDVASYPEGSRARGRGEWYAMQVEASSDFEVSWPVSILCGGLDKQIEHHLFPRLPPERLRQIAPEVKAVCEEHGVRYQSASWPKTLEKVFRRVGALGKRPKRGSAPDDLRS